MEWMLVTALLVAGIVAISRLVRDGTPTLWELQLRHGRGWPVGLQEENDERPWHRRRGTPEWHPASQAQPVARPTVAMEPFVDLTDAGRHAPTWAIETPRPRLERVRRAGHA